MKDCMRTAEPAAALRCPSTLHVLSNEREGLHGSRDLQHMHTRGADTYCTHTQARTPFTRLREHAEGGARFDLIQGRQAADGRRRMQGRDFALATSHATNDNHEPTSDHFCRRDRGLKRRCEAEKTRKQRHMPRECFGTTHNSPYSAIQWTPQTQGTVN